MQCWYLLIFIVIVMVYDIGLSQPLRRGQINHNKSCCQYMSIIIAILAIVSLSMVAADTNTHPQQIFINNKCFPLSESQQSG